MSNDFISSVVQGVESTKLSPRVAPVAQVPVASNKGNEPAERGKVVPADTDKSSDAVDELTDAVSKISDFAQNYHRDLQFSVDETSGRTVIKVIDSETDKVIREIPSEHVVKLAQKLSSPESLILQEQA